MKIPTIIHVKKAAEHQYTEEKRRDANEGNGTPVVFPQDVLEIPCIIS